MADTGLMEGGEGNTGQSQDCEAKSVVSEASGTATGSTLASSHLSPSGGWAWGLPRTPSEAA